MQPSYGSRQTCLIEHIFACITLLLMSFLSTSSTRCINRLMQRPKFWLAPITMLLLEWSHSSIERQYIHCRPLVALRYVELSTLMHYPLMHQDELTMHSWLILVIGWPSILDRYGVWPTCHLDDI